MVRRFLFRGRRPAEDLAAERLAAGEVPAGLGAGRVDRAEHARRIQGDAGAIAALVHAARAVMLDYEFLRHHVTGPQFDHQVAAAAAAGAGREIEVGGDGTTTAGPAGVGDL
jgi:hypothetical protein